ncbi:hypothetical protein B0H17DRAFT_950616, partial [Mycena rosella]
FGVVKRRWGIFTCAHEYPIETQAVLVPAVAALHNFVRIHDETDDAEDLADEPPDPSQHRVSNGLDDFVEVEPREISPEELGINISEAEKVRASARRDRIARQMWDDYVALLVERGEVPNA